jgi:hypothetical protein
VRVSKGTEGNASPCITERNGDLFVVWQEVDPPEAPAWDVLFSYSTDGGEVWEEPIVLGQAALTPTPVIQAGIPSIRSNS